MQKKRMSNIPQNGEKGPGTKKSAKKGERRKGGGGIRLEKKSGIPDVPGEKVPKRKGGVRPGGVRPGGGTAKNSNVCTGERGVTAVFTVEKSPGKDRKGAQKNKKRVRTVGQWGRVLNT